MGAHTVVAESTVAVLAQDAKTIGKAVLNDPAEHTGSIANLFPVRTSSPVNVIEAKKHEFLLLTALAERNDAAVVLKNHQPSSSLQLVVLSVETVLISLVVGFGFKRAAVFAVTLKTILRSVRPVSIPIVVRQIFLDLAARTQFLTHKSFLGYDFSIHSQVLGPVNHTRFIAQYWNTAWS